MAGGDVTALVRAIPPKLSEQTNTARRLGNSHPPLGVIKFSTILAASPSPINQ
jgi:hypothetical protein